MAKGKKNYYLRESDDTLALPEVLQILMANAGPVELRVALTEAAKYLRKANRDRIKANVEPDGSPMTARAFSFGNRQPVMIFTYQNMNGDESLVALATVSHNRALNYDGGNWAGTRPDPDGEYFTGYDIRNADIRTFRYDRVIREYRRPPKRMMRMFQTIGKNLRYKRKGEHVEIGFTGISGKIASEHHYGNPDKGTPVRQLLGLSQKDQDAVKDIILDHLLEGVA